MGVISIQVPAPLSVSGAYVKVCWNEMLPTDGTQGASKEPTPESTPINSGGVM